MAKQEETEAKDETSRDDGAAETDPSDGAEEGSDREAAGADGARGEAADEGGGEPSKHEGDEPPRAKEVSPTKTAAAPPKKAPEPEASSTPLILVAAAIAVATVGAIWWWNNQPREEPPVTLGSESEAPSPGEPPARREGEPTNPLEALGGRDPQRPPPIPAPEDVAAPPANAARTASGLASRVLQAGTGTTHPAATDRVTVHYTGWTTDGEMFDSSRTRGQPATFPLSGVIPGWTEGVQLMVTGETRRFWIPEELAYRGRPGAPAGMLVFDVELISFETPPPPPPVPEDVAAVPASAQRSDSGLAWRVLQPGTGEEHPTDQSIVRVNLTGWTSDGNMFDSTTSRGQSLTIPVGLLSLPGLREGLKLMVQGEKRRFWVPQELAFNGRPGAPAGTLVFDIELVEIHRMSGMPGGPPPGAGRPGGGPPGSAPPPGGPGAPPGAARGNPPPPTE
jgi:peptidylprolyl isomerase